MQQAVLDLSQEEDLDREEHLPLTQSKDLMASYNTLLSALGECDFNIPEQFGYIGASPHKVRDFVVRGVNNQEVNRQATDTLAISVASALLGPKRAAEGLGGKAKKFGSGAQAVASVFSALTQAGYAAPNSSMAAVASALPELGLIMLVSDSSRPSPSILQLNLLPAVKSGARAKYTAQIGGAALCGRADNEQATQAAQLAQDRSHIGVENDPMYGKVKGFGPNPPPVRDVWGSRFRRHFLSG